MTHTVLTTMDLPEKGSMQAIKDDTLQLADGSQFIYHTELGWCYGNVIAKTDPVTGGISLSGLKMGGVSEYSYWQYPLNQSGGAAVLPKDYSDAGRAGSFGANVSAPWATAGYFSSGTGFGLGANLPASNVALQTDSAIWIVTVKISTAAGAGADSWAGNTDLTSAKPGLYFNCAQASHAQAGKMGVRAFTNGTNSLASTFSTAVIGDGADHCVMVAWDAPTNTIFIFVDGAMVYSLANAITPADTDILTGAFRLGGALTGNDIAAKFFGAQHLIFKNSGLPINTPDLAKIANSKRRTGISKSDPVFF